MDQDGGGGSEGGRGCCPGGGVGLCGEQGSRRVRQGSLLVAGFLMVGWSGCGYSFSAYINALKDQFNYTQPQVAMFGSLLMLGQGCGTPAGLVTERVGYRWAGVVGGALGVLSYLALWGLTAARHRLSPSTGSALLSVCFFAAGLANAFSYVLPIGVCFQSFPVHRRALVIAVVEAGIMFGACLFNVIYGSWFVHGHVTDPINQDVGGMFIFLAVSSGVINFIGSYFLRVYPLETKDDYIEITDAPQPGGDHEEGVTAFYTFQEESNTPTTWYRSYVQRTWYMFTNSFLQLLAWSMVFSGGAVLSTESLMSMILRSTRSLWFRGVDMVFLNTTLCFLVGGVAKVVVGVTSDWLLLRYAFPRVGITVVTNSVQVVVYGVLVYWHTDPVVLTVGLVFTLINAGTIFVLASARIADYFGPRYYGRDVGSVLFAASACMWVTMTISGYMYQSHEKETDSNYCYGRDCFFGTFMLFSFMALGSVICDSIAFVKERKILLKKR